MVKKVAPQTKGLLANCFCCNSEVIVDKQTLDFLPIIKIDGEHLNLLICDSCEEDIELLKENGISNVSFDILRLIQEELEYETDKRMENDDSGIDLYKYDEEARNKLMLDLYNKASEKVNLQISQRYLNHFNGTDKKLN